VLYREEVKKKAKKETNRKHREKKAAERKKREEKEVGVGEGRNGKQAPTNDTINKFYSRIAGVSTSKYPSPEPSAPDAPKAIGEQVLDWLPDLLKQVASDNPFPSILTLALCRLISSGCSGSIQLSRSTRITWLAGRLMRSSTR
jgi:hypothetical protein